MLHPLFDLLPVLAVGLAGRDEVGYGFCHVRSEDLWLRNRLGGEEAPAQHFRHVILLDWLDAFLALPVEDVADLSGECLSGLVVLVQVGCE